MSARARVADPQNVLLRVIAGEMGRHITDLPASLLRQVQIALVEAYNRGAYDAHERSTVSPPDADCAGPDEAEAEVVFDLSLPSTAPPPPRRRP